MYGIRVCVCVLLRLLFFRAHSKQTKIPRFYCYFFSASYFLVGLVENISKQLLCATIDKNVFDKQ